MVEKQQGGQGDTDDADAREPGYKIPSLSRRRDARGRDPGTADSGHRLHFLSPRYFFARCRNLSVTGLYIP